MLVVDQRDQQMLESRIFVPAAAGLAQGIVKGLFEFASETRHLDRYSPPSGKPASFKDNVICTARAIKSRGRAYPQNSAEMLCVWLTAT